MRFTSVTDAARAIHELNGKHVIDEVRILFALKRTSIRLLVR